MSEKHTHIHTHIKKEREVIDVRYLVREKQRLCARDLDRLRATNRK